MKEPKPIEALSNEWKSDRSKPHEPFWGPGVPFLIGVMVSIGLATVAIESGYGEVGSGGGAMIGAIVGSLIHQFRT